MDESQEQSKVTFVRQFLPTASTNLLMAAIGIMTGVLSSRLLGPTGRGELAGIQLWAGFLAVLAMAGLPEAMVFYSAKRQPFVRQALGSATALILITSLAAMGLGYAIIPAALSSHQPQTIALARTYLLYVPITALLNLGYQTLRGKGAFRVWNTSRILPAAMWLFVLLLSGSTHTATPGSLSKRYLMGLSLIIPLVAITVTKSTNGLALPNLRGGLILLRFGLPTTFASLPSLLNLRLDQLVMVSVLSATDLGFYTVAVSWSMIISPVLTAVGMILFPRLAAKPDRESQISTFTRTSRLSFMLSMLLAGGLALVTPFALSVLFGEAFGPSIIPAQILIGASVVANANLVLEEGARGMGHPSVALQAEIGGLFITIISLALLLRPFQIIGAAFASILGYSAVAVILLIRLQQLTKIGPLNFIRPTRDDMVLTIELFQRFYRQLRRWSAA